MGIFGRRAVAAPAPPPPSYMPFARGASDAALPELPVRWRPQFMADERAYPSQVSGVQVGHPIQIPSKMLDLQDAYGLIPAAFTAVKAVSEAAAMIPITVYRRKKGKDEPVADHELSEKFNPKFGKSSDWQTAYQFWVGYFAHSLLVGTSYALKDRRDRQGIPLEYHIMRPDWVQTVPGTKRPVDGYLYGEPGSRQQTFKPEEVMPLTLFNPFSSVTGMSPLASVRKTMILELFMQEFNIKFFENGATLGGVVSMKLGVGDQAKADQLADRMNERHKGVGNAHRWQIITGAEEVTELGKSMKDLQYDEGLQRMMQKVLMVCGVPPVVAGSLDGATYANTEGQLKRFYGGSVLSICTNRDSAMNLHICPAYGPDIYVASDMSEVEALLPMLEMTVNAIDKLASRKLITRGEARQWVKTRQVPELGEREDDDDYVESGGLFGDAGAAPTDDAPDSTPQPKPKDDAVAATGDEDQVDRLLKDLTKQARAHMNRERRETKKQKERLRDRRVKDAQGAMQSAIRKNLEAQKDKILGARIDPLGDLKQIDQVIHSLRGASMKRWREGLHETVSGFGEAILVDLGATGIAFNSASAQVVRYLAQSSSSKVVLIDQTTADVVRQKIQDALATAQLAGENITQTATRIMENTISETFGDMSRDRAVRIAQTETTQAYNFADQEGWKQSGVVTGKQWNTQADGKVRSIDNGDEFDHAAMDGVQVGIDDYFEVPRKDGGSERLLYPGDVNGSAGNVIEERCFMTPVFSTSYRVSRLRSQIEDTRSVKTPPVHLNGNGPVS